LRIVDNRGLNCPEPVVNTKRALDQNPCDALVSVVDNEVAKRNVVKFARSQGYSAEVRQDGEEYFITIGRMASTARHQIAAHDEDALLSIDSTLYLVTADEVGRGNAALGHALMKTFLYALAETGGKANHLIFLHAGARLTCHESPVLPSLHTLNDSGWSIATCGACLDYYSLKDKLAIGQVTNMYSIVELMRTAHKVITL